MTVEKLTEVVWRKIEPWGDFYIVIMIPILAVGLCLLIVFLLTGIIKVN